MYRSCLSYRTWFDRCTVSRHVRHCLSCRHKLSFEAYFRVLRSDPNLCLPKHAAAELGSFNCTSGSLNSSFTVFSSSRRIANRNSRRRNCMQISSSSETNGYLWYPFCMSSPNLRQDLFVVRVSSLLKNVPFNHPESEVLSWQSL
jgi:hypothetical protein